MRWRLLQPHYLNVPGTEWEYKEVDRTSGKQARKVYEVPLLLNPNDPNDYNYPGEIIVCHEGKGQRQDIVFVGPPTPDMEPIDEEAKMLSASMEKGWVHPIESLPEQGGYSQSLLTDFQRQLSEAMANAPVRNAAVSKDEFEELKKQMAELMAQNKALAEQLKAKRA